MKYFVRCTHFLTRHHIAHSANFSQLVDLVVFCGARELQVLVENASRNTVDTSRGAVVDFISALGTWVMADEGTDITAVKELSVFSHWEEDDTPAECFMDSVPLKKADAESRYLALVKCIKDKNLQDGNIVGIGVDGAAIFSGKKTSVQARSKKHAPHAVSVHCHLLQLACVQAAISTTVINHAYTSLTTLWKYFRYSPQRAESLKEIQHVLN